MKQAKNLDKHVRARRADLRDAEVGRRVRSRRLECRLSQTELADRIGVTFQQVQKYEKGMNRIGASRLQHLASILQVPVPFFFEGLPAADEPKSHAASLPHSAVFEFLATNDGVRLARAFTRIPDAKLRRSIVDVTEQISGGRKN